MQYKTGIIPTIIIGLIVISFSVTAFFLLDIEKVPLYWWALGFLVLSELVLFSGLICVRLLGANRSKVFMRSGIVATLFLYFLVTLISIIFTSSFTGKLNTFILMELAIIVICTIIIISVFPISRRIAMDDRALGNAREFMDTCENRVGDLLSDLQNKDYARSLNSVYESIKYSDKIGSSSVDAKIGETLTKLEASLGDDQKNKEDIIGIFDEISSLISRRKTEISQSKRGGF